MRSRYAIGVLLFIELVDELVGSGMDAAWPLLKLDLGLSYSQIGLCMGLPGLVAALVDPITSVLGDLGRRRLVALVGGLAFAGALLARGQSSSFELLLLSLVVFYPASGAFVNLAQATLMDLAPHRREINMARWTFLGSAGMVGGPLAMSGLLWFGLSWRHFFLVAGGLSLIVVFAQWRASAPYEDPRASWREVRATVAEAFRTRGVLRWLVLIQAGDLMIDVLMAFLALYFVDVGRVTPGQAALGVSVWTGVGLLGDFLLIPLLARVKGLAYLRVSAAIVLVLFPLFLLVPWFWLKLVLVGLLGFFNSGWYAVLQAQVYAALPGRSGTAMALFSLSCLGGAVMPLLLGLLAEAVGLGVSLWLLLLGPLSLLLGIRRRHVVQDRLPAD